MLKYLHLNADDNVRYRIICICHSGGYAAQYASMANFLPADVDCVIYERPGAGVRIDEDLCSDWNAIVADAWNALQDTFGIPYILFGHSLGGSIAFELAKKIQSLHDAPMPICLAIGDREAPSYPPDRRRYDLDEGEFGQMLIDEYNINPEIVKNAELMDFFLPALRADFTLADTYSEITKPLAGTVSCNIVVFRPSETHDQVEAQLAWQNETTGSCKIIPVNGDHFFVFSHTQELVQKLVGLFANPSMSSRTRSGIHL